MPTTTPFFWRNLLKCLPTTATTTTFPDSEPEPPPPTTSAATSSAIVFNSLFDISSSASTSTFSSAAAATNTTSSESEYSDDADDSPPPDFATVFASQRFFFSSPGLSNSISGSPPPPPPHHHHHHHHIGKVNALNPPEPLDGGVAVKKYSPDPYADFKNSMEEMIESRRIKDARANWDYLHELLSCYLAMNPSHTHGYIISAFADIVVRLLSMPPPEETSPLRPPEAHRRQQ